MTSLFGDVNGVFDSEEHELRMLVAPASDDGDAPRVAADADVRDGAVQVQPRYGMVGRTELPDVEEEIAAARDQQLVVARDDHSENLRENKS